MAESSECSSPKYSVGDEESKRAAAIPLDVREAPTRIEPPTTIAAVSMEDVRVTAGIRDRVMEAGDVFEAHRLHLLVGDKLTNADDVTPYGLLVATLSSVGLDIGSGPLPPHLTTRDECQSVDLAFFQSMLGIVGVRTVREEALSGPVADPEVPTGQVVHFLGAGESTASHLDEVMTVLVLGEDEGLWLNLEITPEEGRNATGIGDDVEGRFDLTDREILVLILEHLSSFPGS